MPAMWDILSGENWIMKDLVSAHHPAVTPAFLDARRRKERNDLTTEGVFPHVYTVQKKTSSEFVNNNNGSLLQRSLEAVVEKNVRFIPYSLLHVCTTLIFL